MFEKILIANRGEIAVRIMRACKKMGIRTVAVYAEPDAGALHVRMADEAVCIGPARVDQSYLHMERILSAAVLTGADAIHPGYGLLSENSTFARRCKMCRICFIGPSADAIALLGSKTQARAAMEEAQVPVVPGSGILKDVTEAIRAAEQIGYPVMLKAAAGGGGKGMRPAATKEELIRQFPLAMEEARRSFGDDTMYMEKLIQRPRHIEFQIAGDSHGHMIHLGERDCSIQRGRQKMIEEAPAWGLDEELRRRMGETAIRAACAAGYTNVGTVEFLLERDGSFYFMEMNTRIQVEHPVTEEVYGVDLVCEQIRIAAGLPLSWQQEDVIPRGHAIECRINAEDPKRNFAPSPGQITGLHMPGGRGVRIDGYVDQGSRISPYYDSMLAKIIVRGDSRTEAIRQMKETLLEFSVSGICTNRDYLLALMNTKEYEQGQTDIEFCLRCGQGGNLT